MSDFRPSDDDVQRGRGALYLNRGRTLTTTETAAVVLAAVLPGHDAALLHALADEMDALDIPHHERTIGDAADLLRERAEQYGGDS